MTPPRKLVIAAYALLGACASPEQRERDQLTDLIEAGVMLPHDARPLKDYSRYYAFNKDGTVEAEYKLGPGERNPDWTCSEMLGNFAMRDVPCPAVDATELRPGQRRWLDNPNDFPIMSDGGCCLIRFSYYPRTKVFTGSVCNGGA